MGIPLVALHAQGPPDPLEQYQKVVSLAHLLRAMPVQEQIQGQQLQAQQLENQQRQMQISQTQAINAAYHEALETNDQGAVTLNPSKLSNSLAKAGHGAAIPGIMKDFNSYQKSIADTQEAQSKLEQQTRDSLGFLGSAIQKAKYDPALADLLIEQRLRTPGIASQEAQQLQGLRQMMQQNPNVVQQIADNLVAQSSGVRKVEAEETQAAARMKSAGQAGGQLPLGPDRIDQLNQGFASRYQVLHPGAQPPPQLQLRPDATQRDFENLDKLLESQERATATKAQQETTNEIRRQTAEIAKQGAEERKQKAAEEWVMWTDPKTGRPVAGPRSMGEKAGAQDMASLKGEEVKDILHARNAVQIINKQGSPKNPESMGVLQLLDSLEKDGKLGIGMSRWNRFVTKRVGASPGDDPRIVSLLNKAELAMTATMQAHFGAAGGRSPLMLAHFVDMANAGKMDAPTLRGGLKAVSDYMTDRGMIPGTGAAAAPQGGAASQGGGGGIQVKDPQGGIHTFPDQSSADKFKKLAGIQ